MESYRYQISKNLLELDRFSKKVIAILIDIFFCILTVWLSFFLRFEQFIQIKDLSYFPFLTSILMSIPIFWICGVYQSLFRFAGKSIFIRISFATLIYGIFFFVFVGFYSFNNVPRSIGIIQPILFYSFTLLTRFIVKFILTGTFDNLEKNSRNKENVLIYGAGNGGVQVLFSLKGNSKYQISGFVDDDFQKHNQYLHSKKIHKTEYIEDLIKLKNIKLILLAIPSLNKYERNKIIKKISKFGIPVKTLPKVDDILDGKITIKDFKDFLIEDLLDRKEVAPDKELMKKNIESKNIFVSGAGGTIGSELCRKIIKLNPNKLILFELNEYALYKIYNELIRNYDKLKIFPILGNCQDEKKLKKTFKIFKIDTLYHAAAYKHVDLVESNICEGVKNNFYSTLAIAKVASSFEVKNISLISSDKAVNPVNIMGASKRLSEICFQTYSNEFNSLNFSIVRFGNVLASSGSVVPKFKEQIAQGGPITLTHPDVTRYFMTINEAAELVIQASAMGNSSAEVFMLDMGKEIKIIDLINRMVNLSGLKIKDKANLYGDIEIKIIGLSPGEKLNEDLMIGKNPQKTKHPKILKTIETKMPFHVFENYISKLSTILDKQDPVDIQNFLKIMIDNYTPEKKITDYLHLEDESLKDNKILN